MPPESANEVYLMVTEITEPVAKDQWAEIGEGIGFIAPIALETDDVVLFRESDGQPLTIYRPSLDAEIWNYTRNNDSWAYTLHVRVEPESGNEFWDLLKIL